MSSATSNTTSNSTPLANLNGQVKWFNNRKTYGWVTVVSEGDYNGKDVFVHQSNINATGFRTLTPGEYVSFDLTESVEEKHPYHATNVSGICGGSLLCDVQSSLRNNREGDTNRRSRPYNKNRRQQGEYSSSNAPNVEEEHTVEQVNNSQEH